MRVKSLLMACLPILLAFGVAKGQTTIVAGSVNGVINPTQYSGSDIGAKVNAAWSYGKTVRIPWGTYSFSTTIVHPGSGYKLECDAGTVLNYTGTGDAIDLPASGHNDIDIAGIDGEGGCLLNGTSSAQSGIHLYPSSQAFIRNIRVAGFTNANHGYGIFDTGSNSVDITGVEVTGNTVGIYLTGEVLNGAGYAANAVHISNSHIVASTTWGLVSEDSGCSCSQNLGNYYAGNQFEGNASGDMYLDWEYGTTVTGNYFESSGVNIELGNERNVWAVNVNHNYFVGNSTAAVTINWGSNFNIEENAETYNTSSGCFINVVTRSGGGSNTFRGVGTNFVPGHEWCVNGVATTNP